MFCIPMTIHCKCKACDSYFKRTVGDCIGPYSFDFKCPYCRSREVTTVSECAAKETLSYIRYRVKKLIK